MATRGIRRVRNGWADQHSAVAKYDDGSVLEMPEDEYRALGYKPPFDDLPWKDQEDDAPVTGAS
jgi:hypothetical protein